MTAEAWCDFGDLPAAQCACPKCRPDIKDGDPDNGDGWLPSEVKVHTIARVPGKLTCGHRVDEGMKIAKTDDGWICPDCDPTQGGVRRARHRGPVQV